MFGVNWARSRAVLLTVTKVPLGWRGHVLQTGISVCSQQPGTVHLEGLLVHLKVIRAHSEKHQLNHVRLVLPVGGFA